MMMGGADGGIASLGCNAIGSALHAGTPLTDIRRWRIFFRGTDRDLPLHEAGEGGDVGRRVPCGATVPGASTRRRQSHSGIRWAPEAALAFAGTGQARRRSDHLLLVISGWPDLPAVPVPQERAERRVPGGVAHPAQTGDGQRVTEWGCAKTCSTSSSKAERK